MQCYKDRRLKLLPVIIDESPENPFTLFPTIENYPDKKVLACMEALFEVESLRIDLSSKQSMKSIYDKVVDLVDKLPPIG